MDLRIQAWAARYADACDEAGTAAHLDALASALQELWHFVNTYVCLNSKLGQIEKI